MSISPLIPLAAPVLHVAATAIDKIAQQRPFADILADGLPDNESKQTVTPGKDAIDLPANLTQQFDDFAQQLRALLRASGIDTSHPIELRSDGFYVFVENDHLHRMEVEQLLASNTQLSTEFQQLVEQLSTLAGDAHAVHDVTVVVDPNGVRFKFQ